LKYDPTEKDLWFLLLGVTGEIGMNINLYVHNGQWQMIDCGVRFFTNHP
jgi:ribonuclease J